MTTLLTRFNLCPPGVRCIDGGWRLLKASRDSNYKNFLSHYAHVISQSDKNALPIDDWGHVISKEVGNYLHSHHPRIQFLDFSEQCNLTLLTHIQAADLNKTNWIGQGRAGATHFRRDDARNRAVSEVLEHILLIQTHISLDIVWSTAVAPTEQLAKRYASKECLERWVTCNAWKNVPGFKFQKVANHAILSMRAKAILYEWKQYKPDIQLFIVSNPYDLCVILTKVELVIDNRHWIFFANGIGASLNEAVEQALLESIQYVPGKNPSAWNTELIKHTRVQEWQRCALQYEEEYPSKSQYNDAWVDIVEHIQGKITVYSQKECPGVFLGCVALDNEAAWSSYKGVPIA